MFLRSRCKTIQTSQSSLVLKEFRDLVGCTQCFIRESSYTKGSRKFCLQWTGGKFSIEQSGPAINFSDSVSLDLAQSITALITLEQQYHELFIKLIEREPHLGCYLFWTVYFREFFDQMCIKEKRTLSNALQVFLQRFSLLFRSVYKEAKETAFHDSSYIEMCKKFSENHSKFDHYIVSLEKLKSSSSVYHALNSVLQEHPISCVDSTMNAEKILTKWVMNILGEICRISTHARNGIGHVCSIYFGEYLIFEFICKSKKKAIVLACLHVIHTYFPNIFPNLQQLQWYSAVDFKQETGKFEDAVIQELRVELCEMNASLSNYITYGPFKVLGIKASITEFEVTFHKGINSEPQLFRRFGSKIESLNEMLIDVRNVFERSNATIAESVQSRWKETTLEMLKKRSIEFYRYQQEEFKEKVLKQSNQFETHSTLNVHNVRLLVSDETMVSMESSPLSLVRTLFLAYWKLHLQTPGLLTDFHIKLLKSRKARTLSLTDLAEYSNVLGYYSHMIYGSELKITKHFIVDKCYWKGEGHLGEIPIDCVIEAQSEEELIQRLLALLTFDLIPEFLTFMPFFQPADVTLFLFSHTPMYTALSIRRCCANVALDFQPKEYCVLVDDQTKYSIKLLHPNTDEEIISLSASESWLCLLLKCYDELFKRPSFIKYEFQIRELDQIHGFNPKGRTLPVEFLRFALEYEWGLDLVVESTVTRIKNVEEQWFWTCRLFATPLQSDSNKNSLPRISLATASCRSADHSLKIAVRLAVEHHFPSHVVNEFWSRFATEDDIDDQIECTIDDHVQCSDLSRTRIPNHLTSVTILRQLLQKQGKKLQFEASSVRAQYYRIQLFTSELGDNLATERHSQLQLMTLCSACPIHGLIKLCYKALQSLFPTEIILFAQENPQFYEKLVMHNDFHDPT